MKIAGISFLLTVFSAALFAQAPGIQASKQILDAPFSAQDEAFFKNPPKVFWPETWFHFIGDNVSKEGIDADLEAIADAGISGIQWFHGNFGGRWPGVEKPITPLSEEWDSMVAHMAKKAHSLGLRLTIQTCPGWAMAGGPWIKPEDAMRDLVWSRTDVPSGKSIEITLPKGQPSQEEWRDYQDICVLAFPCPEGDTGEPLVTLPKVHEKEGGIHKERFHLEKGSVVRSIELPSLNSMNHHWVYVPDINIRLDKIEPDGSHKTILDADMPMGSWQDNAPVVLSVEETQAEEMEITISHAHELNLEYIKIYSAARKNEWPAEAGRTLRAKETHNGYDKQCESSYVKLESVQDISGSMDADGHLTWSVPSGSGKWTVLRFGHVNSGRRNSPAPPEATGWECNKLDPRGAEVQFKNYVGRLYDGPLAGLAGGMLMDSWECNNQTWTGLMEKEFLSLAGYDLRTWMPALTGYVIDSQDITSRFLTDWRRAVTALYNQNFFAKMTELAHEKGMEVQYETAGGDVVAMDPLEYYKYADVPMCEFWQPLQDNHFVGSLNFKPIKPTASAAHIYGKRRVAAESFTSFELTWDEHWEMLKEAANLNMTEGVTHNVFHTYTHNPQVGFLPPGTSFGSGIGTPFLRGQTWWKYMKEFTRYLARTCYMLERGLPVVDVLWFLGDEARHRPDQKAPFPEGFKYDYCNTDVLLNRLSVKDGRLVTPDGQTYELLWVPAGGLMLPQTAAKIESLIQSGAKVVKGKLPEDFEAFGIKPHLIADGGKVLWTERRTKDAHWFYITAPVGGEFHGTLQLLAEGQAELWDAVNGTSVPLESAVKGQYRTIHLDLCQAENRFVVFRSDVKEVQPLKEDAPGTAPLQFKEWTLRFPSGWGAPEEAISLDSLLPWKELNISEEGKAFSGTATYEASFEVPESMAGKNLIINLGDVEMIADVYINGTSAGVLWSHPYSLPVGHLLKEGKNTVRVDVTSTWFNRLVYDASLPEDQRKTWTINGPAAGSPLRPSGLLGPVLITP